jgi:hypothetical protein
VRSIRRPRAIRSERARGTADRAAVSSGLVSHDIEVGADGVEPRERIGPAHLAPARIDPHLVARWSLVAVGAAFLVIQLVFFPASRSAGWDEAVYVSQTMPGDAHALFMDAWRSRGITLLIAPVTILGGSFSDVRLFLTIVSSVALTMAFWLWVPLIGFAAPIGALLVAFNWLTLVGGSAVMPNFWAAILAVAVGAVVARRLEGGSFVHAVGAAILLGLLALFRVTEATVIAGAIGVYILVVARSAWRFGIGLAVGWFLGFLPWILEMSIRFGGVGGALERANSAGHLEVAPIGRTVLAHLGMTYGRKELPVGQVPFEGILWWSLLLVLGLIGLLRLREPPPGRVALLTFLATSAFTVEYFFLVPITAGRFLLPAYALASLSAAIGLLWLLQRPAGFVGFAVGLMVLVLLVPWALWQLDVARRVSAGQARPAERFYEAGVVLRRLAGPGPCSFVSPAVHPQVQLASGCSGAKLVSQEPTQAQLAAARSGEEVFIILPQPAKRTSPLAALRPIRYESTRRTWFIYQLSRL